MGNRAVITLKSKDKPDLGVYLHWCGDRDQVEAFLLYCELKSYRSPDEDCYGWARLAQTIANYFDNGLSIGINLCCYLDCNNGDNGVYEIEGWKIVGRKFCGRDHYGLKYYGFLQFLKDINAAQPEKVQLPNGILEDAARRFFSEHLSDPDNPYADYLS